MTSTKDDEKARVQAILGKGQSRVLPVLRWAILPTILFCGLLGASQGGGISEELYLVVFLVFIMPAAMISETLNLGTYSFWSSTTPVAMWLIMIGLAYVYGVILIAAINGIRRLLKFIASPHRL